MFSGLSNHLDLVHLGGSLSLKFYECSDAEFECMSFSNSHSFNRIYFVQESSGARSWVRDKTDGTKLELEAGDVFFISCGIPLQGLFVKGTRLFAFHFNFMMMSCHELFISKKAFAKRKSAESVERVGRIFAEQPFDLKSACLIDSLIFAELSRYIGPEDIASQSWKLKDYGEMLSFIHEKADASTSVEELLRYSRQGLSKDRLSRKFSDDFGIPPKRYLVRALVGKAAQMLQFDEIPIRDVAKALKFNSEFYFSRFFKKETGVTPSAYRQESKASRQN